MYFLNLRGLEKDLKKGKMSRFDFWFYTVLFIGGWLFQIPFIIKLFKIDIVATALTISFMALLIFVLYIANETGDNKDFFKRVISLSFVIGWRVMLCLLIPRIFVVIGVLLHDQKLIRVCLGFQMIIGIIYPILVYRSLKRVSHHK